MQPWIEIGLSASGTSQRGNNGVTWTAGLAGSIPTALVSLPVTHGSPVSRRAPGLKLKLSLEHAARVAAIPGSDVHLSLPGVQTARTSVVVSREPGGRPLLMPDDLTTPASKS